MQLWFNIGPAVVIFKIIHNKTFKTDFKRTAKPLYEHSRKNENWRVHPSHCVVWDLFCWSVCYNWRNSRGRSDSFFDLSGTHSELKRHEREARRQRELVLGVGVREQSGKKYAHIFNNDMLSNKLKKLIRDPQFAFFFGFCGRIFRLVKIQN
jgi:hypothetical protein